MANVTGSNPGGDLALVSVDIAPGLSGHTPPALLPPGSGSAGGSSPAPAPSGEVRVLVRNPVGLHTLEALTLGGDQAPARLTMP